MLSTPIHISIPARTPSGLGGGPSEPSIEAAAQKWTGWHPSRSGIARRNSKQATNLNTQNNEVETA